MEYGSQEARDLTNCVLCIDKISGDDEEGTSSLSFRASLKRENADTEKH